MKKKTIMIIVLIIICLTVGGLAVAFVIPWFSNTVSTWNNNEVLAAITLAGVFVAMSVPFISNKLCNRREQKNKKAVYQIEILVTILPDNYVRFSASIQNVGEKTIVTKTSNLYIDQGVATPLTNDRDCSDVGAVCFMFPFILEHRQKNTDGRPDCVLCKKCFRENDYSYPEEIVASGIKGNGNLLRTHIVLDHLSHKSVQYINPSEKFSEDVVIQISNAGVYRVTLFVGTEGDADCECATKQFYIPQSFKPAQTVE